MFQRWIVALLSFALGCTTASAATFSVRVKAVDAAGKPVAKADVALFWQVTNGAMTPAGDTSTVTGAAGKAVLRVEDWNEKRPVLVLSADRALGGIVGVSKADDGKEASVTLRPTIRVKGSLECKELRFKPEWANTTVAVDGFRANFAQNLTKLASFEFVLPAGKYTLGSYGSDVMDYLGLNSTSPALIVSEPSRDSSTSSLLTVPPAPSFLRRSYW